MEELKLKIKDSIKTRIARYDNQLRMMGCHIKQSLSLVLCLCVCLCRIVINIFATHYYF